MKIDFSYLAHRTFPVRTGCFILGLLLLWLPFSIPIYLFIQDTNLASILAIALLYTEFIFLLNLWGRFVKKQSKIISHYGLEFTRLNGIEMLQGLAIGLTSVLILFSLEGWFGWLVWQKPQAFFQQIILAGLLVGIGVGLAEELLFRGWLLAELQQDYNSHVSAWANAIIFAVSHFIKPWLAIIHTLPQFPALVLLGLTQVWGKRWRNGRLGLPIGLHSGLVYGYYIINVGNLVRYTGFVPDWITGIDRNPLQGMMGILFIGAIALWMRRKYRLKRERGTGNGEQ